MTKLAAAPAAPPGWETATAELAELARIADPAGGAVAWLAPGRGANVVGYAVRRPGGWAQVLHAAGPRALAERPTRHGCPILFPFPGLVRDARYRWRGREYALLPNLPDGRLFAHGFAHTRPWHVLDAGRSAVTAELATATDLAAAERAGYPFDVRLRLTTRLAGAALRLELEATNEGAEDAPVGLGLHPYFDPALLVDDRARLQAWLPGRAERVLENMIPTGETRPVARAAVPVPPEGEAALASRTDLGARPVATLAGPDGGARVLLAIEVGCRELWLFAPDDQPSVALEPLSCAHSAASRPEGTPDGLAALPPGGRLRLAATIAVAESGGES